MPGPQHPLVQRGQRQADQNVQGVGLRGRDPDQGGAGRVGHLLRHLLHRQDARHLRLPHGRADGQLVTGLAFSPDCRHLISVSVNSCIFVWRLPGKMVATMQARLAASPNKNASRTYITSPLGMEEEFGSPPPEFLDPNANSVANDNDAYRLETNINIGLLLRSRFNRCKIATCSMISHGLTNV